MTKYVARMEEGRSAFRMLTGKPTERDRRIWEGNTRIDLKEIGVNTRNMINSTLDRDCWRVLVNAAFILRVSLTTGLVRSY